MLILSTIFGVNDFVRDYAETLARAGLAAAVWDLYSGAPLPADYKEALARARKLNDSGSVAAINRWADYMLAELRLDSLGVLGFCLGGRFALIHAAKDKRIKACAAAYPSIENPLLANQNEDALALAPQIGCPVHIMQPGHDHVATPETYATLKADLFKRAGAHKLAVLSRGRARLHASPGAGGESGRDQDRLAAAGGIPEGVSDLTLGCAEILGRNRTTPIGARTIAVLLKCGSAARRP